MIRPDLLRTKRQLTNQEPLAPFALLSGVYQKLPSQIPLSCQGVSHIPTPTLPFALRLKAWLYIVARRTGEMTTGQNLSVASRFGVFAHYSSSVPGFCSGTFLPAQALIGLGLSSNRRHPCSVSVTGRVGDRALESDVSPHLSLSTP